MPGYIDKGNEAILTTEPTKKPVSTFKPIYATRAHRIYPLKRIAASAMTCIDSAGRML